MLYSIGYQRRNMGGLLITLSHYEVAYLLDVRSRPYSRNRAFSQPYVNRHIEDAGITYIWAGRSLGGFKPIMERDIVRLAKWQEDKVACLMCLEADPLQCHRNDISERLKPYGVPVHHITEGGDLLWHA